jgi:hypothetical protein
MVWYDKSQNIRQIYNSATDPCRTICSISNNQSWQLQENLTLRRTSLLGLDHIPMLVGALNSTIVFLF